jgi:hypothetical protein
MKASIQNETRVLFRHAFGRNTNILTAYSCSGMSFCRMLNTTDMPARANRPIQYACDLVRLLSSRSTIKPSVQMFSLMTINPPCFNPSLHAAKTLTRSSSVRYSRHLYRTADDNGDN